MVKNLELVDKSTIILYAEIKNITGELCLTKKSTGDCHLELKFVLNSKEEFIHSKASDFFHALVILRAELKKHGFMIGLNGARIDFFPSNMSLQMSSGQVGYLLENGLQGTKKLRTFDPCDDVSKLVDYDQQVTAFNAWRGSLN